MKMLIILALTGDAIPDKLKKFKAEAYEYYLPANQLIEAQTPKWPGLEYNLCILTYPKEIYYALGKCRDILK